jgi:plasmid stabilization system protein ParE
MKIIYNPIFENELLHIVNHIAKDKPNASIEFALELEKSILDIPIFPFKYKPSSYFNDTNVRDMTYKRYTVVYEVNLDGNTIKPLSLNIKLKPNLVQYKK